MHIANRFSAGASRRFAMNAPKILPWMARRAGIDDEQALRLWQRAAAESEQVHACRDGASYHAETMQRFIGALERHADSLTRQHPSIGRK
jgi:hypothetical protein